MLQTPVGVERTFFVPNFITSDRLRVSVICHHHESSINWFLLAELETTWITSLQSKSADSHVKLRHQSARNEIFCRRMQFLSTRAFPCGSPCVCDPSTPGTSGDRKATVGNNEMR